MIFSYNEGLWNVFILDSVAYILVVVVLLSKKISLKQKTWVAFSIFYFLGTGLLFILGFYSGGYIWLFGAALIVGAMIGVKAASIALFINFLSLVSIGVYIAVGSPEWASVTDHPIQKWMIMTANFMLVNTLVTLLVAAMLNSMKTALTKEQKTAIELRKKREELMAIFKKVGTGILIIDRDTQIIIEANPTAIEMTGLSKERVIGQLCHLLVCPAQIGKCPVKDLGQNIDHSERKLICADGHIKDIIKTVYPIIFKGRSCYIESFIDNTERKQAEEALSNNLSLLESTMQSTTDGILVIDRQQKINFYNDRFLELWNIPQEVVEIKDDEKLLDYILDQLANPDEFIEKVKYLYSHPDEQSFDEFTFKDGKIFERYSQPQRIKEDIVGRVWSFRNITKRKQAEKEKQNLESQLQQSQKMESIGTLAGGIAHDFNNILSPILGHTEMLLMDTPEDSPFKESLNEINTSALRAKSLVKQILTFSRQESSELILMKMQPIIKEALKLIRSTIPAPIQIKKNLQTDCGVIKADPTQIHQIVMNLATNAFHAMEETGGEMKVSLKEVELGEYDIVTSDMTPGVYACLTVTDTGVGMDKNLTDKIFDPFFTTKKNGKGTGMGLSVVHGIVTAMKGAIHVYSEPEKGTEFHVYFPIEKNCFDEQVTNSKAPIQGGTEHILLVDDEEAILTMEKLALERLGYQVTTRTSGIEAFEVFRANLDKFDLVITDMAMPNMPGDKLSAELTKIRPDIPVLLCTGFSENMSEEKASFLGINGFLMKPILMKDLAQKIREVLDGNDDKIQKRASEIRPI